jgi:chromate transporter
MKELLQMFWAFSKIGALTFGGGYAMLPIVQREIVETYGWVTDEEVLDYYALAQCSPGVIAVNTAAFIGYKKRGSLGAAVAALGVAFPSLIIILLIASFIAGFSGIPAVEHAFGGIRVAVAVLILNTIVKLWKESVIDKTAMLIFACGFVCSFFWELSPMYIVVAASLAGILIKRKEAAR